ncbi:MAG: GFA family protein [Xanthomonadales bacterium]|nr:GFA family protein [Xanthomonadales bacterium]
MNHETSNQFVCRCGTVKVITAGRPVMCAYCHCVLCRDVLGTPMYAATIWRANGVRLMCGAGKLNMFKHPNGQMQRHFCLVCGDVVCSTNGLGLKSIPNQLIAANHAGNMPERYRPTVHLHYSSRLMDVHDELPKYLERPGGPLYIEPASGRVHSQLGTWGAQSRQA